MGYQIIDWQLANDIKSNAEKVSQIDFNLASVYLYDDSKYLVMPLNPFGKSIIIDNKQLLEDFIDKKCFPVFENVHKFYVENKEKIDNIASYKNILISDLLKSYYGHEVNLHNITLNQIEEIYKGLILNKRIKKNRLEFILLIGEYIIQLDKGYHWGRLENRQFLNPLVNLVIVTNKLEQEYFNVEYHISRGINIHEIKNISRLLKGYIKKSNSIERLIGFLNLC